MAESKITLRAEDEEERRAAAQFVAELVRQGVVFHAEEDIVSHPSGLRGQPGLVVTLTEGY